MITEERIKKTLEGVKHPESGRNIVELGMVRGIEVKGERVKFTLAFPFLDVPIKDRLVAEARRAVEELPGVGEVAVELTEMTQKERARFMALQEGKPVEGPNHIEHVVAVMSGKGGVGKSLVSGLLAVALRRKGLEVGLLDADITGPSIPKMFFKEQRRPDDSPDGIVPVESRGGVKIMSINLLLPREDDAVIWRGPLISSAIKQFWRDVLWGRLDCLVVDLPPGTSDASLTVMQAIPLSGVVLVTSPQELAGMVVRKAARMARKMGAPILGLVENMSYAICPRCGERIEVFGPSKAAETADRFDIPLLGRLPLDPKISELCDRGSIEEYPLENFAPIADALVDRMLKLRL